MLGLVVSVDRCERGQGTKSALQEVAERYGIKTCAIVTMKEVIAYLSRDNDQRGAVIDERLREQIDAYYKQYGVDGGL